MSWASLGANTWISKADVQDAITNGLTYAIGAAPSIASNQWITRDQLVAWVNSTSAIAGNLWVSKNTCTLVPANSLVDLGYSATDCATACANYGPC